MSKKNTKTIWLSIIVVLLVALGVYALTNQNNESNSLGNESNMADKTNNEENISAEEKDAVSTYLENNISDLSSEEAVLGGKFYVTSVSFPKENVAIVNYEDGHIALTAEADYIFNNEEVIIDSFELIEENDEDLNAEEKAAVNTYLENNISNLSPEEAVLGGAFQVRSVSFPEEGIVIVNYEDGHIALTAKANYEINSNNEVEINSFELIPDGSTAERGENNDGDICVDMCGDGVCQEMVCMGEGCPCAETAQSCSADCP